MTLGGLAAAIGLVIDDAIVVVENIVLHRDAGEHRVEAVRKALSEITTPLIGSTITPVVVFLPLVSVSGVTGSFFRALAITMTAALLTSLALALTWTPGLSYVLLRERAATTTRQPQRQITPPAACSAAFCDVHRTRSRLGAGQAAVARRHLPAAGGRHLGRLPSARLRPAAGDGRGRLHPRLHHARGQFAERDQPRSRARRAHPAAPLPKWRSPRAAPACRWAWPPSPRPTPATSP